MEDFLKFLLIAGVIIIGIAKEIKKNKSKKSTGQRPTSFDRTDPDAIPMPEAWGKMFPQQDIFQPTPVEEIPSKQEKQKKEKRQMPEQKKAVFSSQFGTLSNGDEGARSTNSPILPSHLPPDSSSENENDYTIHSAEEARRAIVWSEILQRKY